MTSVHSTVFVVDDDVVMLFALQEILRSAGYLTEAFAHPADLLARLSPNDIGCALLDLQMPQMNGLEIQQTLVARGILLPVIFVSGHGDIPNAVEAMRCGAIDFLTKPIDPQKLLAVVAEALRKDTEFAAVHAARQQAQLRWTTLSPREQEVCRLAASGLLLKQIAAKLETSASAAQMHRARAWTKLGVSCIPELVHFLTQFKDEG